MTTLRGSRKAPKGKDMTDANMAAPRNRGGRPQKKEAGLTKPVSFRLTEADHAAWLAKVEASGMSPSDFFRDAVLTNKTQIVARKKATKDTTRLQYLFNKTSNNMNQLAYRANADHLAGKLSEATYAAILAELSAIRRALLDGLQ